MHQTITFIVAIAVGTVVAGCIDLEFDVPPDVEAICENVRTIDAESFSDDVKLKALDADTEICTVASHGSATRAAFHVVVPAGHAARVTLSPETIDAALAFADTDCSFLSGRFFCGAEDAAGPGEPETVELAARPDQALELYVLPVAETTDGGKARLEIDLWEPVCGDGVIDVSEACDDGNAAPGDGCDAACQIEYGFVCDQAPSMCTALSDGEICERPFRLTPGEAIVTDLADANADLGSSFSCGPDQPDHIYVVDVPSGGSVTVQVRSTESATVALATGCEAMHANECIENADIYDETARLTWDNTAPDTRPLYVRVASRRSARTTVVASIKNAVCGDGIIDPIEGCDDANSMSGDGCSDTCQPESGYGCSSTPSICLPTQDNDDCSQALAIQLPFSAPLTTVGNTSDYPGDCTVGYAASTDVVYVVDVPAGESVGASVEPLEPVRASVAWADDCASLESGVCRGMVDSPKHGAIAWSVVESAATMRSMILVVSTLEPGAYRLDVSSAPPGCGNGIVEPLEGCDDGDVEPGDGCGASCAVEAGWLCEGTPSRCQEIPPNDTCADAVPLVPGTPLQWTTHGLEDDYDYVCELASGNDAVFSVDVPADATLTVELVAEGFASVPSLALADSCAALDARNCVATSTGSEGRNTLLWTNTGPSRRVVLVADADGGVPGGFEILATLEGP